MIFAFLLTQVELLWPKTYSIAPQYKGKYFNQKVKTNDRVIALTFDDGPHPIFTPMILTELRKRNVKATFFVLGKNAEMYPLILREIVLDGHAIGTHSFSHRTKMTPEEAFSENQTTSDIVFQITGVRTQLFRPPYGLKGSSLNKDALKRGWASFGWSISSADTATKDPEVVFRNVCFTPGTGEVVLLHDIKPHTATAMPKIISELTEQGFKFVTLPELTYLSH